MENNFCLLIVDVQNGFINKATQHIPALVEKEQKKYQYIIATKFFNPENSLFRKLFDWHEFSPGSKQIDLAFSLDSRALVVDKSRYGFINDDVKKWLYKNSITCVHVCGIDTDICVTQCAVELFENNIEPIVLKKLCASTAGNVAHINALKTLERFIGAGQIQ